MKNITIFLTLIFALAFGGLACSSGLSGLCDGGTCQVDLNVNFNLPDSGTPPTPPTTFSPASISNFDLWLRSDHGVTTSTFGSSTIVTEWDDMGPNGYRYSAAGSSALPTSDPSTHAFNGFPGVHLGANQIMSTDDSDGGVSGVTSTGATMFVVIAANCETTTSGHIVSAETNAYGSPLTLQLSGSCNASTTTPSGGGLSSSVGVGSESVILATTWGPDYVETLYVNGTLIGETTTLGPIGVTTGTGVLGDSAMALDLDLAEVLEYNRVLSTVELGQITTYLKTRYAITP